MLKRTIHHVRLNGCKGPNDGLQDRNLWPTHMQKKILNQKSS